MNATTISVTMPQGQTFGQDPVVTLPHTVDEPARPAARADGFTSKRLQREFNTMAAMVHIYCRDQHHQSELCSDCAALLEYAALRLERCRFGAEKPTCAKCPVHCYQRNRREQVRAVMRYAGPRMLWEHPGLSLYHWLDGLLRKQPALAREGAER